MTESSKDWRLRVAEVELWSRKDWHLRVAQKSSQRANDCGRVKIFYEQRKNWKEMQRGRGSKTYVIHYSIARHESTKRICESQ